MIYKISQEAFIDLCNQLYKDNSNLPWYYDDERKRFRRNVSPNYTNQKISKQELIDVFLTPFSTLQLSYSKVTFYKLSKRLNDCFASKEYIEVYIKPYIKHKTVASYNDYIKSIDAVDCQFKIGRRAKSPAKKLMARYKKHLTRVL